MAADQAQIHLFIDTNIFLFFYHFTSDDLEELRKLAVLLEEKKVVLYLTDQVIAEFRRNREGKIADALKGLKEQRFNLQFPQVCKDYPEYAELRKLQDQYENCHAKLLEMLSQDVANKTLKADETISGLFAKATRIETTPELVERAKLRVNIGNPPGKEGSLGDAISWEALLKQVPAGTELHFITDDRDYVSALDENRFKDFLLQEWTGSGHCGVNFYRRLSSFFRDHFPQIKLASELEKELAIRALAVSLHFSQTHKAVARLAKYTEFTGEQMNDIVRAAVSNNQVSLIVEDEDVHQFLSGVISGNEEVIDAANLTKLQRLLSKNQIAEQYHEGDDVPF
jgi:hypothetical protein